MTNILLYGYLRNDKCYISQQFCPDGITALYMSTVAKSCTYIHPLMYCVTGLSSDDITFAISL